MFYVISGASGAGKSTVLPLLQRLRPDVQWHAFDERWAGGSKRERQQLTEGWIQTALGTGGHFGLLGQCPLGEMLAAPSAPSLADTRHLLLDVDDVERIRRLRERGDGQATQDLLNWAAWLRAHQTFADWQPDVLTVGGWEEMRWDRWLEQDSALWPGDTLNATGLTPQETALQIVTMLG
jgi:hypothetical protein